MTHEQQLAEVWQPRLWEEVYVQSWLGVPGASCDGSQRLGSLLTCAPLFLETLLLTVRGPQAAGVFLGLPTPHPVTSSRAPCTTSFVAPMQSASG